MWEKAYEAYQTGCKVVWSTGSPALRKLARFRNEVA